MDPRSNSASGLGLPQPGNDMGQLPPIHTPQSFHAPDTPTPHFDTAAPHIGAAAPAVSQPAPLSAPAVPMPTPDPTAQPDPVSSEGDSRAPSFVPDTEASQRIAAAPVEDTDTAFDEEWVGKARQVVSRTHTDPFLQSQELSKLKAQYIKLRYNKDIKVE